MMRSRNVPKPVSLYSGEGKKTFFLPSGSKWVTSFSPYTPIEAISAPESNSANGIYRFHLVRDEGTLDKYRVELAGRDAGITQYIPYDTQFNVGFNLHIPPDWQQDNEHELIWQLHHAPDPEEVGYSNQAPLSLRIIRDKFFVDWHYSTGPTSYAGFNWESGGSPEFGSIVANSTIAIAMSYKLSRGHLGTGNFSISLNGAPAAYSYTGHLGYDDIVGATMKFGIYKARWKPGQDRITTTSERRYGFSNMTITQV